MLIQPRRARLAGPLTLECGRTLEPVEIAYEVYGELNAARSNAILVCHGLTSNQHAAGRHQADDLRPGWWDQAIGPGKPIATERWCVIASNVLGGGASTGPASIDPASGQPYGPDFPVVTVADMVDAQARLLDALGIERLHAAVGGCLGGFQVLTWMSRHPQRLARAVVISATARVAAYTIALWKVMREALALDPDWRGGRYHGQSPPERGVQLMSRIGALIWMEREALEQRCGNRLIGDGEQLGYGFDPEFEVEALFEKIGRGDVARLDPLALVYLMRAMDYFDLARGRRALADAFEGPPVPTLLVSYRSDWRYPPAEMEKIRQALAQRAWPVTHRTLDSAFGHGAFVYDSEGVGVLMRSFLEEGTT